MNSVQIQRSGTRIRARVVTAGALALAALAAAALAAGCSGENSNGGPPAADAGVDSGSQGSGGSGGEGNAGGAASGGGGAGGAPDPGPNVDTSEAKLYTTTFKASDADPDAEAVLANQNAFLDTSVKPRGVLVVYLHGAGKPTTCGSTDHGKVLAGMGFHVIGPCYVSDYGVGNCGDDIEGCRLEAFEGVDHHPFIDIKPADSIEVRVAKGLVYLQEKIPQGDWTYFLDGDKPKWSKIIASGISHGASTSGVIGQYRSVERVVSLSGPLDSGQAWLSKPKITPIDRFFGFTHTGDSQHAGHLESFADMGIPGDPISVDNEAPPYDESHRLVTSAPTDDGHGSTQAGGKSPKDADGNFVFMPVWSYMYTSDL